MFEDFKNPFDRFEGRPLTATAVAISAVAGACFNLWGAFQIFSGVSAYIFLVAMMGVELFALLSLTHIITDRNNNHHLKANIASVMFFLAVLGCATSGHRAFSTLAIDIEQTNISDLARADREEARAAEFFTASKTLAGTARDTQIYYGEKKLAEAAAIKLQVAKKTPPPEWLVWCLLALFETIKCGGRWAVATTTSKTWSKAQRKAHETTKAAKADAPKKAKKRGPRGPYKPRKTKLSVVN